MTANGEARGAWRSMRQMLGRAPGRRVAGRAGALFGLALLAGCAALPSVPGFYDPPAWELAGPPGSLMRIQRYENAPLEVSSVATAYKVLYRSTGLDGKPIAVSGVVIVPRGPAPADGRRIVAWAHPTTGVIRACAPSLYGSVFKRIPGLAGMLKRGYVVTATDYPGLGGPGAHPYLVGVSEARAVLDSVRAARALPGAGAGTRFVAWGHSQGGHAVLWTGQLAPTYAPELRLMGLAAAAPATDLGRLFERDKDEFAGKVLSAMTIWSWNHVFGYTIEGLVDPAIRKNYAEVAGSCSESFASGIEGYLAERRLQKRFLLADPTKIEPWRGQMARNTPGAVRLGAPVFISQGTADKIVRPPITLAYVRGLCRQGSRVQLYRMQGISHSWIAVRSADRAVAWMADRLEGKRAPTDCRRLGR